MLTYPTTHVETVDENTASIGGHLVTATWTINGADIDRSQLRAIREAGDANWSDLGIDTLAQHAEWLLQEAYERPYKVAFVEEGTGGFDVVEEFRAKSDELATAYAEKHYGDRPWYLLDSKGEPVS